MVAILFQQELIGHARDVIANHDVAGNGQRELFVVGRHRFEFAQVKMKKTRQAFDGLIAIAGNDRVAIEICDQEVF
jgi:hypothetical protein